MDNLGIRNGEVVNILDLAETDIFQMLMERDRVNKKDFLRLCDEARREIEESADALLA